MSDALMRQSSPEHSAETSQWISGDDTAEIHSGRESEERVADADEAAQLLQPSSSSLAPQPIFTEYATAKGGVRWRPETLHALISLAAGTVMCLFGYEQGVFGGIIVGAEFDRYFNHPSPSLIGFITSVYDIGCCAGSIMTIFVGESLGRKNMLIGSTIVMAAGIIMQTAATDLRLLLWGRFIAGVGNGGNTATAPVWHVETSLADAKGKAVVKEMVVNVLGFVMSNLITMASSQIRSDAQWRFPLGIQLLYIVLILALVPFLPESPRWLLARGRKAEAYRVLTMLGNGDVNTEFAAISDSVLNEEASQVSWRQLFRAGQARRRLLLGMGLQIMQQATGINVLCYYLPLVLRQSIGLSEMASRILATANSICFMFAVVGAIFCIDRFGRRNLLMFTAAAQAVAFLGIAVSTDLEAKANHLAGIAAAIFISLYFVAFGLGWAATPWLYPAEVNSLSMRTKGAALATSCDWFFNWLVVQTTPIGIHHLQWGLYLIYALLNASFVPLVYYFIVETAGKSLEQIDRWFDAHPGWLVHRSHRSDGKLPDTTARAQSGKVAHQRKNRREQGRSADCHD